MLHLQYMVFNDSGHTVEQNTYDNLYDYFLHF